MARSIDDIYDELLVLRCQDGESDALNELVSRWHGRLLVHAYRLTGCREDAADVLQDAWLAIVRGIRRLDDPARFRSWAYRIVTYKSADRVRRAARQRRVARASAERVPVQDSPEDPVDHADEIGALRAALRALPGDRRAILTMHHLESMPLSEIAVALGIPEGTVKSRLHHARVRLKTTLEQAERKTNVRL